MGEIGAKALAMTFTSGGRAAVAEAVLIDETAARIRAVLGSDVSHETVIEWADTLAEHRWSAWSSLQVRPTTAECLRVLYDYAVLGCSDPLTSAVAALAQYGYLPSRRAS